MADGSSTPHFFKPLTPGFLSDFRIPKSFLKHLRLTQSNSSNEFVAVLKNTSKNANKTWLVKVDSDGGRFTEGWKEFAFDHCLTVGEFVVFRYLGGFVFDVLVFDSITACERSFSADQLIQRRSDDFEISDRIFETKPDRPIQSKSDHSEMIDQISEIQPVSADHLIQSKSNHSETSDPTSETEPLPSHSNGDKTYQSETNESDRREDPSSSHPNSHVQAKETSDLHTKKNDNADEKVIFKPSKYPYFRSTVKQYSFTWHATLIPTDFARTNNLAKRWCEVTIIDQKNRTWPVNLRYRKVGKDQVYLASGWDRIRDAHELKVGDAMVFELINSGSNPVMKFYKLS